MAISELRLLEGQIGFYWGIIVGALASYVFMMTLDWTWYYKLFATIGEIGIMGSLAIGLRQTIIARRNYITTQQELKKINEESNKIIAAAVPEAQPAESTETLIMEDDEVKED